MGTLHVQVKPSNTGSLTVRVWKASSPGGTPLDESFTVSKDSPLDQSWDLDPALYAVTISWQEGSYFNISSGVAGNGIVVDGASMYYQVLGKPADANGISATFGARIS